MLIVLECVVALWAVERFVQMIKKYRKNALRKAEEAKIRKYINPPDNGKSISEACFLACTGNEVENLQKTSEFLKKLRKEIPNYFNSQKGKDEISQILCCDENAEEKFERLRSVETSQKDMLRELQKCEEEVAGYAGSRRIVEVCELHCLNKEDTEERLRYLKPIADVVRQLEVQIPSYVKSENGKKRISEILCSSDASIEEMLHVLEEVISLKRMIQELRVCEERIGRYAHSPHTGRQLVDALCLHREDIEERLKYIRPPADVLQRWEVEIPNFLSSEEVKRRISEILFFFDKGIEEKVEELKRIGNFGKR